MNTKNKILLATSTLLAFVLLTGFRHGGPGGWGGPRDPEFVKQMITSRMEERMAELKVDDSQKQALLGLKDSLFADGQKLFEDNKDSHAKLLAQWDSPTPDAQAVHALVDSRMDAFRAFAHKVADAALEAHRILTPEQRQQVTAKAHEHMNAR